MRCHRIKSCVQLPALSLPSVLVFSVVIMLLVLAAYSALSLDFSRYSVHHGRKQLRLDIESAVILLCRDSCLCMPGCMASVRPYAGAGMVTVRRYNWGLYDVAVLSGESPETLAVMLGRFREHPAGAAFWLCDRNRALSLSADSGIDGPVYVPVSGINYTEVGSRFYGGEHIPDSLVMVSGRMLPPADSSVLRYAGTLCRRTASLCPPGELPSRYVTFSDDGVSAVLSGEVRDTMLGHVHVLGEELEFCGSSLVSDILVSARKVVLRAGFRGRMQIFASDTVLVERGACLEYPSGIYVAQGVGRPYVRLDGGSKISGYVIVIGEDSDSELRFPSYIQEAGARVEGLIYVNGSCELGGEIRGAVYIQDCYHFFGGNIYAGTLCGTRISRCDSLAFPVMLEGEYRMRQVKMLH